MPLSNVTAGAAVNPMLATAISGDKRVDAVRSNKHPEDGGTRHTVVHARALAPLILSLVAAVGAFVGMAHVEESAASARAREDGGLIRGAIVDRYGRPLAYTVATRHGARRVYTLPDLASVLGYRDSHGRWHGLERRYQRYLDADPARHDWRTFFLHLTGRSIQGDSLRLTLDRKLQRVADAALGLNKGAVVALEPSTGDVLAMVTKPYCPPDQLATAQGLASCRHDRNQPLLNRALQLLLPPGSAFKIVTLSAAMDTRRFSLNTIFSGADAWGPSPYFDNNAYPSNVTRSDLTQLTLMQALAFSDNFTFAHIGVTLGAATLLRYAHRYYIGRRIPFDYPVARSYIANGHPNPTQAEVAQGAFGAEVDHVTALQMALIASAVANGGVMLAPHLVEELRAPGGTVPQRYRRHALDRVMSRRADGDVVTGMVFVVDHGSGYRAQIGGLKVAGKTGTAASGAYNPHAWFIAFAPARHPIVAVAVLREFAGEAFKYAAPIARKILVAALQERGYHVR